MSALELAHLKNAILSFVRDHHRSLQLLSIPRVAAALKIGTERVRRAVATGQIPSIQLGNRRLVSRSVLEQLAQGARR
jgi:excisionase family DNA binding protein